MFPELCVSSYAIDDLLLQGTLLDAVEDALDTLIAATAGLRPVLVVGAPLRWRHRLYNCGVAIHGGRVLGVVPKSYLPNYREFYEKRHFALGTGVIGESIRVAGTEAPFGTDLLFAAEDLPGLVLGIEVARTCGCRRRRGWRRRSPAPPCSPTSRAARSRSDGRSRAAF